MIEDDEPEPLDFAAEAGADELLARDRPARRIDQIADQPIRPPPLRLRTATHDRPRPSRPRHIPALEAEVRDVQQPTEVRPTDGRVVPHRVEDPARERIALKDGRLDALPRELGRIGVLGRRGRLGLGPLRRRRVQRRWTDAATRRGRCGRRFGFRSTGPALRGRGRVGDRIESRLLSAGALLNRCGRHDEQRKSSVWSRGGVG